MTKIQITAPITPAWQRANAKAAALYRQGVRAERIDAFHYRVASSRPGHAAHHVAVESVSRLLAHCDCESGSYGRPCVHASLALSQAAEEVLPALQAAPVAARPSAAEAEAFMRRMAAA